MSVSGSQFALDLKQFGIKNAAMANTVLRKIALELDQRIVLATPVDTGRARGNWYPSINSKTSEVDLEAYSKTGQLSLNRLNDSLTQFNMGDVFWFINNVPYILLLENGHSKQAIEGMVDVNLSAVAAHYGGRIVR